jgi:polyisoprenoid-binding protein YceI
MRLPTLCLAAIALLAVPCRAQSQPQGQSQVPVFQVTPVQSSIRFNLRSSKPMTGNFDKWTATLTFSSRQATSGVLDVEIQAASLHTAGGPNGDRMKGRNFLDVEQDPVISFKTDKVTQTGKTTFDLVGTFTMRGVSKPATLNLVIADETKTVGYVQGIVPFEYKDYGMTGINKNDDRGEVDINLKVEQVSGPQLVRQRF